MLNSLGISKFLARCMPKEESVERLKLTSFLVSTGSDTRNNLTVSDGLDMLVAKYATLNTALLEVICTDICL
jgi:hypothetical protein